MNFDQKAYNKQWRLENAEYDKQYYKENAEQRQAYNKQWRKNNPKYHKQYSRQWRLDNPDHQKQYYKENAEHKKEYQKQWAKDNLDKCRTYSRTHRTLKNGAVGYHTEKDLQYIYEKQKGMCMSCKVKIPYNQMTLDHIKPLSKSGSDLPYNIQLLCGSCNSSKGNHHTTDYRNFGTNLLRNKSSIRMMFK